MLHEHKTLHLESGVAAKGYTMVLVELYLTGGRAKVKIALVRNRQEWDRRQTIREHEGNRKAQRTLRDANRRRG